jgi:hypothetical protein
LLLVAEGLPGSSSEAEVRCSGTILFGDHGSLVADDRFQVPAQSC